MTYAGGMTGRATVYPTTTKKAPKRKAKGKSDVLANTHANRQLVLRRALAAGVSPWHHPFLRGYINFARSSGPEVKLLKTYSAGAARTFDRIARDE